MESSKTTIRLTPKGVLQEIKREESLLYKAEMERNNKSNSSSRVGTKLIFLNTGLVIITNDSNKDEINHIATKLVAESKVLHGDCDLYCSEYHPDDILSQFKQFEITNISLTSAEDFIEYMINCEIISSKPNSVFRLRFWWHDPERKYAIAISSPGQVKILTVVSL